MALTREQAIELGRCSGSPAHFIRTYCYIYDAVVGEWLPFEMWPMQREALRAINNSQQVVILKARQLGITWLVLCYMLWMALFRPINTSLVFSRRDAEAVYLLSDERLRGIFKRLPDWMTSGSGIAVANAHEIRLTTGSTIRAFPTTAGDSYTASLVIVDEADLSPDLARLMRSVKPTVDNGGKIILLSRSNKDEPGSQFKNIYRSALRGENGWKPVFLPWHAHPGRTREWYADLKQDVLSRTGSLDELYEQYPATDWEALLPKELDRRIPFAWLEQCFAELRPLRSRLGIPGLRIYHGPIEEESYVIGADPAEGNPTSDDSAAVVFCRETGQQMASLQGKLEPAAFASHLASISAYYRDAPVLVERNNHGHTVIAWLKDNAPSLRRVKGMDRRDGWQTSSISKANLYDTVTLAMRESNIVLHDRHVFEQLSTIDGSKLQAPGGQYDDMAMAAVLAYMAIGKSASGGGLRIQWQP